MSQPIGNGEKYQSWCMSCCCAYSPLMLTTYCLPACHCDNCGVASDLALVKVDLDSIDATNTAGC